MCNLAPRSSLRDIAQREAVDEDYAAWPLSLRSAHDELFVILGASRACDTVRLGFGPSPAPAGAAKGHPPSDISERDPLLDELYYHYGTSATSTTSFELSAEMWLASRRPAARPVAANISEGSILHQHSMVSADFYPLAPRCIWWCEFGWWHWRTKALAAATLGLRVLRGCARVISQLDARVVLAPGVTGPSCLGSSKKNGRNVILTQYLSSQEAWCSPPSLSSAAPRRSWSRGIRKASSAPSALEAYY
ncbi:hypothetical protein BD311DRAFT_739739 [Dichomitus squalens]|uniref:Uncharacterized protein n=1 Tax=Dichomitus squalens TaxID=114155 RepID=A0A4Q9MLB8_9APHY|nr:hypothetical protein BD311DRAFT_739739 [Dichomitus squalens]